MEDKRNKPSASRFWVWFSPVGRQAGGIGFILNRITALGLTLYLFLHLVMLGKLAQGPQSYDSFIATAKTPLFIFGELLVVAAVFIHGFNGIRIILTTFDIGVNRQKQMFYALMLLALVMIAYFAIRMVSFG
ncbi:MAG: succinate dehydrogenase, cytochrome b556 subunit [Bellilinea sp.]